MVEKEWRKPGLSDEENAELDAWHAELNSPSFKHGMDVGESHGAYMTVLEAQRAYDAGEIELWLAWNKPKTVEGWDAMEAEYGDLHDRWAEKQDDPDVIESL